MKVLPSHGYVLKTKIMSHPGRLIGYVLLLFVLVAIPFTYYLAGHEQDIRQRAATGNAGCIFTPRTVRTGETAELLIASYPYKISPVIEPSQNFIMIGKSSNTSIIYQFNKPGTTWTASLVDPVNPIKNGKPNKIASCTVTTSPN